MNNLSNLLSYYIECVEIESFESLSYPSFKQNEKFILLDLGKEWSCSDDNLLQLQLTDIFRRNLALGGQNKSLYYGWPLYSTTHVARDGREYAWLSPVFLLKVTYEQNENFSFRLRKEWPKVNNKILKIFTRTIEEKVNLINTIGISEIEQLPEEGLFKLWNDLKQYFPQASIIDEIDPNQELTSEMGYVKGFLNKAMISIANPPRYSKNLLKELKLLKDRTPDIKDTALNVLLTGNITEEMPKFKPSLITKLNRSQRASVKTAFSNRLSVITGPPGTGKSQVVLNILANAFEKQISVLFTSKNNKAVDVVCEKLLNKIKFPTNLRLGARTAEKDYTTKFLDLLDSVLAGGDQDEINNSYTLAKNNFKKVKEKYYNSLEKLTEIVNIRNSIDKLDKQIERYERLINDVEIIEIIQDIPYHKTNIINKTKSELKLLKRNKLPLKYRILMKLSPKTVYNKLYKYCHKCNDLISNLISFPSEISIDLNVYETFLERVENIWSYIKLYNQIKQQRVSLSKTSNSIKALSDKITELEELFSIKTREYYVALGKKRMNNLSINERRALTNYHSVIEQLAGDYPGNRAYAQLKEQQENLFKKIIHILPVWSVTNLSAGSHFPLAKNAFDLLVIDEASQSDIASAIPLLYRAKNVVIIGDPNQLQHISTIGNSQNNRLMQKYDLIAEEMLSFSYNTQSLYKCARGAISSDDVVMLNEHYRSHFSIIEFSNNEWYAENLDIRTNYDNLFFPPQSKNHIEWINITGNTTRPNNRSALNTTEAKATLDILEELKAYYPDKNPSFGIVTPFTAQAKYFKEEIVQRFDENAITNHLLIADTAHKFQGDERDIVLFSPVISAGASNRSSTIRFLRKTKNLFNVAITRARSLLWVIGDRDKCLRANVSFLQNFIEYIEQQKYNDIDLPYNGFQSPWEKKLFEALVARGHEPVSQKVAGPYFIDIALVENDKKIAIEVDGKYWHQTIASSRLERDLIRDNNLRKMHWQVLRFWVFDLKYDLQSCLAKIESALEE